MTRHEPKWLLLLLLLFLLFGIKNCAYLAEESREARNPASLEDNCVVGCARIDNEQQIEAEDAGTEVSCGLRCRADHCSVGCHVWKQALNSSCQEVCNATQKLLYVKELYCTIGCQNAVNEYFEQIKANIKPPPMPILVKDSLAETSLTIKWNNASLRQRDHFKVLYFAQWKYENSLNNDNWRYCDHQNWNGDNQIFIYNLQPYTNYRFRLAIMPMMSMMQDNDDNDYEALFSKPSEPMLTLPRGPPTSAPVITKALAIDHSRIYVNWEPGLFTNRPLFSYVLRLQQRGHEAFQLKDIPITQYTFMFQNLDADTNYSITLTMRNSEGEGPADSTFVTTLLEPEANSSEKPNLIITSEKRVVRQSADLTSKSKTSSPLIETAEQIRDSAIHLTDSRLYLCDSADRLYLVAFDRAPEAVLLVDPNNTDFRPWSLSVDWLNSRLYIAGSNDSTEYWEIGMTGLDDGNVTEILTGLMSQPIQLEVDPYNGYLFWLAGEGIYRVDLAKLGGKPEPEPQLILKKQHLGAFLLDYANRRLLVAYKSDNTVKSVSLDGEIVVDVRVNVKQPKFKNVTSIAMTNGLFYWTNSLEILGESYEPNSLRFLHNVIFNKDDERFLKLQVLAEERQPTPVPKRSPTRLQAVALADRARISWRPPELLYGQSPGGAWTNWSYSLLVEDEVNGEMIQVHEIAAEEHVVENLRESSIYSIKVAAHSPAGEGPWSVEVKIRTLRKELSATILWNSRNTILQSDLIGGNQKTLLNVTDLEQGNNITIVDLAWYEDLLFVVGNNSRLYAYNTTSRWHTSMKYAQTVNRVAFDWISMKVYWADNNKQIILRAYSDGSHREAVTIAGIVQKLLIDSPQAHLYWSTRRTVEVVRLNGQDRRQYRSEDDFDGRHVSGLTLDLDNRFVYWIIGDNENDFKLYRSLTADMLPSDQDILPEVVSMIQNTIGHSLSYVSDRFIYLDSTRSALTTDVHGKFTASLTDVGENPSFLSSLSVMCPIPAEFRNMTPIAVRPKPVNASSIAIVGTWRDFNVTWEPIDSPHYGRIFYEVSFADYINVDAQPMTTSRTSLSYANADRLLPYSLLEVTLRAYTYWEAAPRVSRVLRSPQTVPSQPSDPRVFVESFKDPLAESVDYFATFRWGMPEFVNGLILGFTIQCWFMVDGAEVLICDSVNVTVSELEYTVHNLQAATAYFFQVRAFAEVGAGPYTDTVSISTENENPVPQLLVATMEDVKKIDLDERSNLTITRHIAVEVANLASESKIYWINEMQELVTADVDGNNITKILTLNNTALSLCADWISRNLFWTESDMETGLSHVMKLDITIWEARELEYSRIFSRNRRIVNLDIAPLTGNLFWFELSTSDLGFVMQSDLSGDNVQPFFNHTEDCSCPFKPMIQPVFTIDNTDPQNPVIYWISDEGQLYIADIEGCICSLVVDMGVNRGLPPDSLTTDKKNIYWSNKNTGKIHYADKNTFLEGVTIKEYSINDTRSIRAIGKSLQPYPDSDCLIPQRATYSVQQIAKTSTSITVRLPPAKVYLSCEKYKLPATKYSLDVAECREPAGMSNEADRSHDKVCESVIKYQTYRREFEARGLKPFTDYRFRLTLTNYYSDQEFIDVDQYGTGLVFKTDVGVPSKPDNLKMRPLTPTLATVDWSPSEIWNADYVRYRVLWRSTDGGIEGEKLVKDGDVSTYLQPLEPGREYAVRVRAYPENYTDMYSQSDEKILKMHPEPRDLILSGVSSGGINITWTPSWDLLADYALEFTESDQNNDDSNDWRTVGRPTVAGTKDGKSVIYQVMNLKSKKSYKFRLILKYRNSTINYVWPSDDRFTIQTLEDIPTAPGTPALVKSPKSNYQIKWKPAISLHTKNLFYFLQGATINTGDRTRMNMSIKNGEALEWKFFYNGTATYWDVPRDMRKKYVFRVRAKNDYGYGNWSNISLDVDLSDMTRTLMIAQEHAGLILVIGVSIVTILLFCCCVCRFTKKTKEDQKKIPIKIKPNVELATLREIPRGNYVEANSLYVAAVETGSGDSLLPRIPREQISLAKFLGKGAFGEVFQGTVRDIYGPTSSSSSSSTPIAVKTLRKGATAQEKSEFLQEAKLMSQFQHKHVLRLLGVCLDTDPPLMLLELMAGGDLLSYLRNSRSLKPTDSSALRLQDLLSMCEDVARGCRYLEELHFVHRDLACRNCLVSARERQNRVVKIGDFGLARDIYKSDYYRKEGEGLLPVRWMAPESLVDGVFTSQSDVWAFGVLMWEITSLGQQPYQARTNVEVLHHVRAGGRLPKPLNSPIRLHQLMLKCWSTVDARPSFKDCLDYIVLLRNSTEDAALSPVNQFHATGNPYKSSHFKDNLSIKPLFQDSGSPKPMVRPKQYSWMLEDDDLKDPRAAYEIPKSIPIAVNNNNNNTNLITYPNENRYIEICSNNTSGKAIVKDGSYQLKTNENYDSTSPEEEDVDDDKKNLRWDETTSTLDRRPDEDSTSHVSSTASLSDKHLLDSTIGRQTNSYTELKSVSPLNDQRFAHETTVNSPLSYSTISFYSQNRTGAGSNSPPMPSRLQRSKSSMSTRANVPLVIDSAFLNMLRQESQLNDEDDDDDELEQNFCDESDKVTDL